MMAVFKQQKQVKLENIFNRLKMKREFIRIFCMPFLVLIMV